MRPIQWINGNKLRIDTGHRTFDRQCECLSPGNVWGTCQFSSYIRPKTETECNGFSNPVGHLRDFDLKPFKQGRIPSHILKRVLEITDTRYCILYEIRSWTRDTRPFADGKVKVLHGYILTDAKTHKLIRTWAVGPTHKSNGIIRVATEYVSNP